MVYRIGIFQGDPDGEGAEAAAEGRFVHVYVDNVGGQPGDARAVSPIPAQIRDGRPPAFTRIDPSRV